MSDRMKTILFVLLFPLVLSACKVELYSNLAEGEANEMMALLLKNGVDCEKMPGQEQSWILSVDEADTSKALELLKAWGYPKQAFASMGDVFKKEGLVSSPLEERIRFIYALSQELSHTISQIDGVLAARVHVVLPENNPFSEHVLPSAASVFIKYRPDSAVSSQIPQIKELVINSIEGLKYDKVSVVLFEASSALAQEPEILFRKVLGVKVARDSLVGFWILTGTLLFLLLLVLAGAAFFMNHERHEKHEK